nr:uncharacterized protein LOC112934003 isoform X2 [Vulpes vulpes]
MVFGLGCQRERLYKPLYVVHVFILAGVVYYYFQGSVGKPAPDHEIAGEPSQLVGESLRPVWGPMDKCYPVTTQVGKGWGPPGCGALAWAPWVGTERRCSREGPPAAHSCESLSCLLLQRRRVKSEKKPASEAVPPKAKGGLNGAAPEGETDILSQHEGEAAGPGPAGKEVAEEEEVAGVPGWEENTQVRKETAVYASEASEMESKEGRPGGWVPQLLRKLWLDWFPAPDIPKTQNHERPSTQ